MKIVVDGMGSDAAPNPDVEGSVLAARAWGDEIILTGDEARLREALATHDTSGLSISIVHADDIIDMHDKPAEGAKEKQDSSIHVGLRLVRDGEADAFVTVGNTGVTLAVAMLYTLKRIRGVKRPALTAIFPNATGMLVAADIGANAECKPEHLAQFAVMSSIFTELSLGIESPRVGLLSNGEEEGKGNTLVHETDPLIRQIKYLNYIGNVEPKDALAGGTDVVIHDGFVGNIFIKSIEATASMVSTALRQEITAAPLTALGGLLAKPAFNRVRKRTDPFEVGGVPLLGVDGIVIIGHGRTNALGIKNAIRQARQAVEGGVIEAIKERLG